jgi:hypothetical protein
MERRVLLHGFFGGDVKSCLMPGPIDATCGKSSGDFKSRQLVGLGGLVPRGLGGDRSCVSVRAQGDGAVWHHGGVSDGPGKGLHFVLQLGDGLAEDDGCDFRSMRMRRSL